MKRIYTPISSIWLPVYVVRKSSLQHKARQHNENHRDGCGQFQMTLSVTQYPKKLEHTDCHYNRINKPFYRIRCHYFYLYSIPEAVLSQLKL